MKTWDDPKDPDEIRDYSVDWSADLGAVTIASSTWTALDGVDVLVVSNSFAPTGTIARFGKGGTGGLRYRFKNHIVLSDGEELEQTCELLLRDK